MRDLSQRIKNLSNVLPEEDLSELLIFLKFLKGWEDRLESKEKELTNKDREIKSNYSALMSAKREISRKK